MNEYDDLTDEEFEAQYSMKMEDLSPEQQEARRQSNDYWDEQRRQGNLQSWEMHQRLNRLEGYEPRSPEQASEDRGDA